MCQPAVTYLGISLPRANSRSLQAIFVLIVLATMISTVVVCEQASAQGLSKNLEPSFALDQAKPSVTFDSPFTGSWTYRSFLSDPNLQTPVEDLLFGAGNLELLQPSLEKLSGSLGGDGWSLDLKGNASFGNPATIRFQGKGTIGGEEWIYDYTGYLVPLWPNGELQRPAIVGTIVRTKEHSNGRAKAGVVAQWIAVRKNDDKPSKPIDYQAPGSLGPVSAASWSLENTRGASVDSKSFRGSPTVLVFTKGFECIHCAEQINIFAQHANAFTQRGAKVVFVVATTSDALRSVLGSSEGTFAFLADPEKRVFRSYGLDANDSTHGVCIEDSNGVVRWKDSGPNANVDISKVLEALESISPKNHPTGDKR